MTEENTAVAQTEGQGAETEAQPQAKPQRKKAKMASYVVGSIGADGSFTASDTQPPASSATSRKGLLAWGRRKDVREKFPEGAELSIMKVLPQKLRIEVSTRIVTKLA